MCAYECPYICKYVFSPLCVCALVSLQQGNYFVMASALLHATSAKVGIDAVLSFRVLSNAFAVAINQSEMEGGEDEKWWIRGKFQ